MEHENIRVDRDGPVATVTIDHPATRNACSIPMWIALRDAFRDLSASDARVVVLTGDNGDFCSGANLGGSAGPAVWEEAGLRIMRLVSESVLAVHECPIPIVAKVDGCAIGAGLGLALAADLLWCSDRATFAAIFAKRGLSLDSGTSWLLGQRIGVHKAKELAFRSHVIDALGAADLGLVNAVVAGPELDTAVADIVKTIAAGPPIALSMTKRMLDDAGHSSLAQALEREALAQVVNLGTTDTREAIAAFIEKRRPVFEGR